jgi:hypothetical protein
VTALAWLTDSLEQIAASLIAAGVNATVDERTLNAPGALVNAGPISYNRLSNRVRELAVDVSLIARDTGTGTALDHLATMLDAAATVFPIRDATPQNLALPNLGGDPLPAVVFRITVEIT